jgi:putative Mn2+ efflux pump MntP
MEQSTTQARYVPPETAGDLAQQTTLGVLIAVVLALFVRTLALGVGVDLGPTGVSSPFALTPLVMTTVVAGVGAAVAYAALDRLTARPVRNFLMLGGLVFVGMMLPVILFAPTLGVTSVGQVVLAVLHAVVAVPLVGFVVGVVRL